MSMQLSSHCLKATEPYCMISWRPSLDKMSPFLLMTITAGMPRTPKALFNSLEKLNCKNICYGQHFRKLCLCFQARSFLIGCWICFVYFLLRTLFSDWLTSKTYTNGRFSYICKADWQGTAGQSPWLCMYSSCCCKLRSPDTKMTIELEFAWLLWIRNCSVKIGVNCRHGGHQWAEK